MRYVNVATLHDGRGNSTRVDLEVFNSSSYTPFNASLNTLRGGFVQLSLACNHEVELRVVTLRSCARTPSCILCDEPSLSDEEAIKCYADGCACYGGVCFGRICGVAAAAVAGAPCRDRGRACGNGGC